MRENKNYPNFELVKMTIKRNNLCCNEHKNKTRPKQKKKNFLVFRYEKKTDLKNKLSCEIA